MLLQTNSYIVPKEKRTEHARLLQRFRQTLAKLGCDMFECYEQTGTNWAGGESSNRFVQIMRFRDRKHWLAIQQAEKIDPMAQNLIKEFCELINFPYQQQQGYFAVGFYTSVLPVATPRIAGNAPEQATQDADIDHAPAFGAVALPALPEPEEPPEADSEPEMESVDQIDDVPDLDALSEPSEAPFDPEDALAGLEGPPDPLQPKPGSDVATADFGDILDLDDKDLVLEDEDSHPTQRTDKPQT